MPVSGMSELASENSNNSRGGREAVVLSTGFPLTGLGRAPDVGPPDPGSEARAALNTSARANLVQITEAPNNVEASERR